MVAYKLYLTGDINQSTWSMLNKIYRELWYDERDSRRKKARESDGGPNYYIVRQHRVGKPLIHLIQNLITDGSLTTYKAGKILGVKPKNVQPLISTIK